MKAGWCALIASLAAGSAFAAQVETFSPQGEVKGVRQVAVRFSEPMVAFGDPRLPEPFVVDCAEPGTGRWADQKNWIYDFSRDLPAGLRCGFSLKADLLTLSGDRLEGAPSYEFSTGGPAILEALPYEGALVDEEQIFVLGLDAPVREESVLANAYCDVHGVTERVPVRMVQGDERKTLLASRRDFIDRWLRVLFKDGHQMLIDGRPFGKGARFEDLLAADERKMPVVVLQCQRRLPNNAEVRLVWGKGVSSVSGVATGQDQSVTFKVRDVFQVRFSCERASKDAGCLPILPMRLSFTAPVSREQAAQVVLKPAGGKTIAATLPDARNAADFVDEVSFPGPFPERAQFTIEMPVAVTDDAGRKLVNQKRFPLAVRTDEYPPLAKFPARFGIIELKGEGVMPVTLRNLEAMVEARPQTTSGSPPLRRQGIPAVRQDRASLCGYGPSLR